MAWSRSTLLVAVAAAGCAGQSVPGRWTGPFPLSGAHACDLRLLGDRSATIACDGTAIVGAGHYRWDDSRLTIDLPVLTYAARRVRSPAPFVFTIQGRGNIMEATFGKEVYEWHRTVR